jgi:5-methylthioadenosine/S-adenosylhomocysteine deaminase
MSLQTIDLMIRKGTILCLDEGMRVLEDHAVSVDKGRILSIQPDSDITYQARKTIDATDCLVLPGLINAHTHLPMTYFRGLADDLPLHEWLNDYIWPLEAKLLDSDFIGASALHSACEMIKHGVTQINDMYFGMESIASACSRAGLRAMIGEAVLDVRLKNEEDRACIGTKALELRERYSNDPLLDFSIAPHAPYTCSQKTLEKCAEMASEHGLLLHTHLSETREEARNCLLEHGLKPVFYLQKTGILAQKAVYAHAIWVDEDEIELLAQHPASIAMCTESNLKLASGILPLSGYLRHGVNVCFATDGVASNNNLDLFTEMDFSAKLHKQVNGDPSFLKAEQILRMATVNTARALGAGDRRGSLEPGKDADIVILSLDSLEGQPLYNPYSLVVYTLGSGSVRDVVIAGDVVLQNRHLTRVDEKELIATAKTYAAKIRSALWQ